MKALTLVITVYAYCFTVNFTKLDLESMEEIVIANRLLLPTKLHKRLKSLAPPENLFISLLSVALQGIILFKLGAL